MWESDSLIGTFSMAPGWFPGIYTSVEDFNDQIRDYDEVRYQVHHSMEAATKAWVEYFGQRRLGRPATTATERHNPPPPFQTEEFRQLQRVALRALHQRYGEEMNLEQPAPTDDDLILEKPDRRVLARSDLRDMLTQACRTLHIPEPIYRLVTKRLRDSRWTYRHIVSLVPPEGTEGLVVRGRLSYEQSASWEDATRLGLRRLCQLTTGYVDDYNSDLVQRWKVRYGELASELMGMEERMDRMLRRNEAIRQQIQSMDDNMSAAVRAVLGPHQ
ncbi:hypothetical protein PIB30_047164 [Stylosanthes scabra]|uniref:Uncharacterized protein n=1 Tax=Stylosanthes scabra TaxID=79078 RepID=A0ABU6ZFE1_9FABA|nr:hypothetical protein [Stylosanthes scabra]